MIRHTIKVIYLKVISPGYLQLSYDLSTALKLGGDFFFFLAKDKADFLGCFYPGFLWKQD